MSKRIAPAIAGAVVTLPRVVASVVARRNGGEEVNESAFLAAALLDYADGQAATLAGGVAKTDAVRAFLTSGLRIVRRNFALVTDDAQRPIAAALGFDAFNVALNTTRASIVAGLDKQAATVWSSYKTVQAPHPKTAGKTVDVTPRRQRQEQYNNGKTGHTLPACIVRAHVALEESYTSTGKVEKVCKAMGYTVARAATEAKSEQYDAFVDALAAFDAGEGSSAALVKTAAALVADLPAARTLADVIAACVKDAEAIGETAFAAALGAVAADLPALLAKAAAKVAAKQ